MILRNHQHDCEHCDFLGVLGTFDLYRHGNIVIARKGDDPSDYASTDMPVQMSLNADWVRALKEAEKRANGDTERVLTVRKSQ